MTSPYRIDRDRGAKEAAQQLAVLREKWPLAFPVQHHDVRPLVLGVARQIAATMGWSLPYALGVLGRWKMTYCRAVRSYDQRIGLDDTPAEPVDAVAKDLAAKQLAKLKARNAAKKAAASAKAKAKPALRPRRRRCAIRSVQGYCAGARKAAPLGHPHPHGHLLAPWPSGSRIPAIRPREDIRQQCGVPSRHWLAGLDRLYQRSICRGQFVPIIAVGIIEQFAQCQHRENLRLVHARNLLPRG
jgi:hypothetical protein